MSAGRIPTTANSPLTTKGDLFTYSTSPARLAVGANGEQIVADSSTATGLKWQADTVNTVIDAKGDLLAGTAADTVARLAVGANNTVLTADSSTATGLKWATPSASTPSAVGCLVYSSVNQATTSAAYKNLEFNTEIYDTDGFHSTVTNTQRITIPSGKAGKYLFTFLVNFDGNATGRREFYIYKNGVSASIMDGTVTSVGAQDTGLVFTAIDDAIVGDYYSVSVWQNSGTSLNVRAGREKNFFGAVYLGA